MKSRYKIAFLTSHVIQYQGPLFKKLAENPQIDLTVLFCSKKGAEQYKDVEFGLHVKWDRDLLEGYSYKFLKNYSPFGAAAGFFQYMNFGIYKEMRESRYDAIIIFGYGWFISWFAWASALFLKIPIIFRGETNLLRLNRQKGLKRRAKEHILRIFFSKCECFLPIGKLNGEYFKYFGIDEKKLFSCPYAVDNDFFTKEKGFYQDKAGEIKSFYKIPVDKIVILFAGKFLSKKCPLDLLEAYKRMTNRQSCTLVFVGDGPLSQDMSRFVSENNLRNVYFLGFLNQTEITKIYSITDVFVFPSDFEPFGLVLNEVMCFGIPVIISDQVSAGYDLVRDNGFTYPAGDITKLTDLLDRMVGDADLRCRMGKRSSEIIAEWSYDQDVRGILDGLNFVSEHKHGE